MRHALNHHRSTLATITARAMFSRGEEPEFPRAALQRVATRHVPRQPAWQAGLHVGQAVHVRLVANVFERGFIDFVLAPDS
jgi:hypothetical protein